jgi:hypothetical protein
MAIKAFDLMPNLERFIIITVILNIHKFTLMKREGQAGTGGLLLLEIQ